MGGCVFNPTPGRKQCDQPPHICFLLQDCAQQGTGMGTLKVTPQMWVWSQTLGDMQKPGSRRLQERTSQQVGSTCLPI